MWRGALGTLLRVKLGILQAALHIAFSKEATRPKDT